MKTTRKKYSTEFKIWAAKASMGYKSVRLAAEKLKINRNCLQHWKNRFRQGKLPLQQPEDRAADRKEKARLQKELRNTRLELDILKEGAALLRGPRRSIYLFIRENAGRFPTGKMCTVFAISPSCYYRWLRGLQTSRAERRIFYRIRDFKDLPLERRQVRKPENQPGIGIIGYQGLPFAGQKDHGRTAAALDSKIKI